MALRVWLPLNGNLKNQGLSNLTTEFSTDGITYAGGKTGSNPVFSNKATGSVSCTGLNGMHDMTVSLWVKTISGNTFTTFSDVITLGATTTYRLETSNSSGTNLTWYGLGLDSSGVGHVTVENDKWYNITMTVKDDIASVYKDGVLIEKRTIATPTYTLNGNISLGNSGMYCSIADVRIYDECLTDKQIKEISKGLVYDLKLDNTYVLDNIYRNDVYSIYNNYSSSGTTGSVVKLDETYMGASIYRLTMTPNDSSITSFNSTLHGHGVVNSSVTYTANTKYVFWTLWRPVTHMDTQVGGTASNIGGWTEIPSEHYDGDWNIVGQKRTGSVTEDKSDGIFTSIISPSLVSGESISVDFCCPHLLSGTDSITKEFDYLTAVQPQIDFDSSGNNYNITYSSGFEWSSDTACNSGSIKFTSTSGRLIFPTISYTGMADSFTFSWWGKVTSGTMNSKMAWGFSDGNRLNFYPTNSVFCLNTEDSASNPFITDSGTSIDRTKYDDGNWHHYVITGNGTTNLLYIDGVYLGKSTTYRAITGTQLIISGWGSTTDYKWLGNLSNFRLYSTVLSATDIKALYNQSAYIDNKNKHYAGELIETAHTLVQSSEIQGHNNFGDTFTRTIIDDNESPDGKATQFECTAVSTTNSHGFYISNSTYPWKEAYNKLQDGKQYVISWYVKTNRTDSTKLVNLKVEVSEGSVSVSKNIGNEYTKMELVFTYDKDSTYKAITNYANSNVVGDIMWFHSFKVEEYRPDDKKITKQKQTIMPTIDTIEDKERVYRNTLSSSDYTEI